MKKLSVLVCVYAIVLVVQAQMTQDTLSGDPPMLKDRNFRSVGRNLSNMGVKQDRQLSVGGNNQTSVVNSSKNAHLVQILTDIQIDTKMKEKENVNVAKVPKSVETVENKLKENVKDRGHSHRTLTGNEIYQHHQLQSNEKPQKFDADNLGKDYGNAAQPEYVQYDNALHAPELFFVTEEDSLAVYNALPWCEWENSALSASFARSEDDSRHSYPTGHGESQTMRNALLIASSCLLVAVVIAIAAAMIIRKLRTPSGFWQPPRVEMSHRNPGAQDETA